MLYILDRQEKVIGFLKNEGGVDFSTPAFFDDVLTQDLQTGAETFTFTTIDKEGIGRNLVAGNYVAFKYRGKYKLFQIMQTEEVHEEVIYITVYCESAGLELINKVFRATKLISADQRKFLNTVLFDTGWNVGMIDATNEEAFEFDLEDSTVYATLQNNINKFGVELEFRVEINNGRISQKFIDTYASRGRVTGKRFVFGKDIEKLTRKVDTTSLFTALVGKGKNGLKFSDITVSGIKKPLGQDFVADEESFNRYNNNGYHIMGIYEFDTTSPEELLRATYKELQKCKQPKIEYEIDVALLGELLGEEWNEIEIGDTVTITDTSFNPAITLMARVTKLETSFTNKQNNKCTLANFIEVSSNITAEMRKIASKLEGYVDNTISGKFPIGSDDIKQGAVLGKHIYKNSITTEHLQAESITAEKLDSKFIESLEGRFNSLKVKDAEINQALIKNAQIVKADIDSLKSKNGEFEKVLIGKADIGTLNALDGKISQLSTIVLTAKDLTGINGDIKNLKSETAKINSVLSDKISTKQLEVVEGNFGKLKSDLLETNKLVGQKASISQINVLNGEIEKLKSVDAKFENIFAGNITGLNIKAESLDASKFKAGTITAREIKTGIITAESGLLAKACITNANIGDAEITGTKIAHGSIGAVNITDGAIISSKIAKAQITGAHIQNASIEDAHIKSINASKIATGVLDAKNITVKNLSADSITVGQINGRQIQAGAITKEKLDENLNGVIKNTTDNVDDALKKIGLVKQNIEVINTTVSNKADSKQVKEDIASSVEKINTSLTEKISTNMNSVKAYADDKVKKNIEAIESKLSQAKEDLKKYSDEVSLAKLNLASEKNKAYVDGVISAEEQKRIKQMQDNLNTAVAKVNQVKSEIQTYADKVATEKSNMAKQQAIESANSHANNVAESKKNEAIIGARTIPDTRSDNQNPSWYIDNYGHQTITEFKYAKTVGVPVSDNPYGTLETKVPWGDSSGGYPTQTFRSNSTPTFLRHGVSGTEWSAWVQIEDSASAQAKVDIALNTANNYTNQAKNEAIKQADANTINKIKGIQIGVNNLILNSGEFKNTEEWSNNGAEPLIEMKDGFSCLKAQGSIKHNEIKLEHDKEYVYWCEIMFDKDVDVDGVVPLHHWCSTSNQGGDSAVVNGSYYEILEGGGNIKANTWSRISLRFKTKNKKDFPNDIYFRPFIWKSTFPETFWLKYISLTEGNKASSNWAKPQKDIEKEINQATTIANGKNTVIYSASQPSTSGRIENDIWFNTNDGYKMYKFTKGSWVATQFGTNAIASNSITGDKIIGSSITAGKIASGSITSDKIYSLAVTSDKLASNSVTAGKVSANAIKSENIVAGAISTEKLGANAVTSDKINVEELFVSENAFVRNLEAVSLKAEQITTGKISSDVLDLTGLVSFEALKPELQENFIFDTSGKKTYINGGHIYTNSVTADKINAKGLAITDKTNMTTFKIDDNGEVFVTGNLQSSNFDEVSQTGYKLTKDGNMELNNALVRGDVILPNAGITNFGGQRGNKNFVKNSNFLDLAPGSKSIKGWECWGDITVFFQQGKTYYNYPGTAYLGAIKGGLFWQGISSNFIRPNAEYTLSLLFGQEGNVKGTRCDIEYWNDNNKIATHNLFKYLKPTSFERRSFTFKTINQTYSNIRLVFFHDGAPSGSGYLMQVGQIKLEEGNKATEWYPSQDDNINFIRFFAGTDFDNREKAPFKVYQDGTLYATKGNFEGTFSGSVDVGNIHISDTNSSQAVFKINTNNDSETKIFLSEEGSYFNTDLAFGTKDKKQIEIDVKNRKVNVSDATFKVNRNGNNGWVEMGSNTGVYSPMSIGLDKGQFGDYRHDLAFTGGGLIFNNVGARGSDRHDYYFRKKNGAERVKVNVDGSLDVEDNIVLGVMKIAKKTDAGNEGVDFII